MPKASTTIPFENQGSTLQPPALQAIFQQSNPIVPQIISPPVATPLTSPPNIPSVPASNRPPINNAQLPAFATFQHQSPNFNPTFPNNPPHAPIGVTQSNAPAGFQYPPQTQENFQYAQDHPTAKLLLGKPQYAPSDMDSSIGEEDYFDLDIETYYAKGNNACGFIPGLPVILTDTNEPETDEEFLASDYASISGRSSVYDG